MQPFDCRARAEDCAQRAKFASDRRLKDEWMAACTEWHELAREREARTLEALDDVVQCQETTPSLWK